MEPAEERWADRKDVRRRTTPTLLGDLSAYGLPGEAVETAVRRVGFLGLIVALMAPSAYFFELFIQPKRVASAMVPAVAALLFVYGSVMCLLSWRHKVRPDLLLDLGLVFQVVVAFAIALSENVTPWPEDQFIRGVSWNCLWISMYVVAIPGTYGKSVLAAITAACMTPFGLLVASGVNHYELPSAGKLLLLLLPPFVAAAWAIPAARYLYRLGTQVSRARALGSYELLELIGRGGMGEVWRAKHRMLARISAIKLIRPEALLVEGAENTRVLLRRFEREARATAALRSPHTVDLYDYGTSEDGDFYYVMELLEGFDLETLVQRFGPLPAGRVLHLLSQAAKSLGEAHSKGLVHRDIKPRNIFACHMGTDLDFVKVLDFGLVKLGPTGDAQSCLTREGVTTGTPAYMAPEVAMGRTDIDGRADLYSLGCVAYWLLTGQLVFDAPNAVAMVLAHVQTPPVPPSQRTELEVPEAMERVILQCLEKDPGRRPATARELADLLAACEGVNPWTREEAERWWSAHMPHLNAGRAAVGAGAGDETW